MSQKLRSGYTKGETWAALRSAWKGFKAAKATGDAKKLALYKERISRLQGDLGLKKTAFRGTSPKAALRKRSGRRSPKRRSPKRKSPKRKSPKRRSPRKSPKARRVRRSPKRSPRKSPKARRVRRRSGRR